MVSRQFGACNFLVRGVIVPNDRESHPGHLVPERALFDEWQDQSAPQRGLSAAGTVLELLLHATRRKNAVRVVIVVQPDADLLQIVRALSAPSGLPSCLNRRQQKSHQDSDDSNHHQ
jgi:hypothetical protein